MTPPFGLTETDKASATWLRLKTHLQDRLDTARVRNDHGQTEAETAALRGEIKTLKALLSLGEDQPNIG